MLFEHLSIRNHTEHTHTTANRTKDIFTIVLFRFVLKANMNKTPKPIVTLYVEMEFVEKSKYVATQHSLPYLFLYYVHRTI